MSAEFANAPPPRLLFVVNEALFFTTHRMPVALAMRDLGAEVHVAAPPVEPYAAIIRDGGLRFHPIPLVRGGMSPAAELKLILALRRLLTALRPDLAHLVAMKPIAYGGPLARALGVPAVVLAVTGLGHLFSETTAGTGLARALVTRLYGAAFAHPNARVIFQNPDDLALFAAAGRVEPSRTVIIRGCGVDPQVFAPRPEPEGEPVVMFPGRLIAAKGVRVFVDAARRLKEAGVGARFVLVGRTDPENPTSVAEREIRAWDQAGLVEWWGFRRDMPETYAKAHVVCVPSHYREGVPRNLIEAAACGRAIVTTDAPGCREIVRAGENGLLVPPRDPMATADAIRRLLEDAGLRRRLAARGREIACAEFAEARFVADHLAIYRALMGARFPA